MTEPRILRPSVDDETPPSELRPLVIRWVVPNGQIGMAYQHAAVVGAHGSLCSGHVVDGAVYPPPDEMPRCVACVDRLREMST
jgi:hypothetical protein